MTERRYLALFDPDTGPRIARALLVQVVAQAVRDGRRDIRNPDDCNRAMHISNQIDAIDWLNDPRTAQMVEIIDLRIPQPVTLEFLRGTRHKKLRTAQPKPYKRRAKAVPQ